MWDSSVDGVRSFQAFNLGWVELEESQLLPSKSQTTINQAIRFITGVDRQENDEWNPASGKLTEKVIIIIIIYIYILFFNVYA